MKPLQQLSQESEYTFSEAADAQPKRWQHTIVVGALTIAGCLVAVAISTESWGRSPTQHGVVANADGVVTLSKGGSHEAHCTWGRANCNETECCASPGLQCYRQSQWYSQCRESCTEGPEPTHWDPQPWSCMLQGKRSPGKPNTCSGPGEDCSKTLCCQEMGAKCFEKVPGWAACKQDCIPDGPDLSDADDHFWSCKALGPATLGASPWVNQKCAATGDDCRKSKCCGTPGHQCYSQSGFWAQCKESCTPGKDPDRDWEPSWSCDKIGTRTPGAPPDLPDRVAPWVKEKCGWDQNDCSKVRCCLGMNKQCFQKNDNWAMCKESCTAGKHIDDNNETWSCRPLGPRSNGLTTKGAPSMFCWALFRTTVYEMDLLQLQLDKTLGIFQCDGQLLLSTDDPVVLGRYEGEEVKSRKVEQADITTSVDGTAGNAKLFINAWNVIIEDGRWNNFAWTIKVDPDAVLVPNRLRTHLSPHRNEVMYFLNCNAFPSSPDFPMMYGALEVLSWGAMDTYVRNSWICMRDQAQFIPLWGEDRFMKKCLDMLGVAAVTDFAIVGDGVCTGVDCGSGTAAFHPFKSVALWQECWDTATR